MTAINLKKAIEFETNLFSEAFEVLKKNTYEQLFILLIKPFLRKYDCTIDWCMGGVSFTKKNGKEIDTTYKDYVKLVKILDGSFKKLNIVPCFSSLWELMSELKDSGRYSLTYGMTDWKEV